MYIAPNPLGEFLNYIEGKNMLHSRVRALETSVGTTDTAGLRKRTVNLETSVGTSTSGLVKDVNDLKTSVNNATTGLDSKASQTDLTTMNTKVTALQEYIFFLLGKKDIFLEGKKVNIICGLHVDVDSNFGYFPETMNQYPIYFKIINNRSFKMIRVYNWTITFTFNQDVSID